jgi:hypothetical protein
MRCLLILLLTFQVLQGIQGREKNKESSGHVEKRSVCPDGFIRRDGICFKLNMADQRKRSSVFDQEIDRLLEQQRKKQHNAAYNSKPIVEAYDHEEAAPSNDDDDDDQHEGHRLQKVHEYNKQDKSDENIAVEPPTQPTPAARAHNEDSLHPIQDAATMADVYFLAVVAGCSVAGLVGLVVAGVCWYKLQKSVKETSEVQYPAYGITGPNGKEGPTSPGDRKLAQSAQMYHYQHQKQQMIALEKANGEMKHDGSDEDSEEENEEGDYTVYECPGLAPTGEMEVRNPLFSEETPVTPTPDDRRDIK